MLTLSSIFSRFLFDKNFRIHVKKGLGFLIKLLQSRKMLTGINNWHRDFKSYCFPLSTQQCRKLFSGSLFCVGQGALLSILSQKYFNVYKFGERFLVVCPCPHRDLIFFLDIHVTRRRDVKLNGYYYYYYFSVMCFMTLYAANINIDFEFKFIT